jgi:hypothetical protein
MSGEKTDYWSFFSVDAARTGSALYARLAEGVGGDPQLREIAARAKPGQPHANILFGAVHFLLLRGARHALRNFYPNLNGGKSVEGDPFPAFRDFCLTHRAELDALVTTRVTNTNEVGRSAMLHPGFRIVAEAAGEPLHLIEIGPSAGLNLIWDRYGVNYTKNGKTVAAIAPDAKLVIECEVKSEQLPPTGMTPRVASRVGLELNPVDLSKADDRDWLRALMWPDQIPRLERFDRAIALFESVKPEILSGDALDLLPEALARAPRDEPVCVYHTIAVYQFSRAMREALDNILIAASLRRPVHRLSFEFDGKDCALSLIAYRDGARQPRDLAICHPHGTWIDWRDNAVQASRP